MVMFKVKETIRRYGLISPADRVVVAVSGGPDSVCLLSVLHALSRELHLSLHIAHLDHMFRGRESAQEALFVADLAKRLQLPALIEQYDVPGYCRERGLSPQAGAREVRYGFLSRVAKEVNADRIATGHTATDQAETLLLRLVRGAGVAGLAGIPVKRENIIRPLIEVTREEISDYLASKGLSFVTDPSNSKPVYARNRVRNELLPVLRRFNPAIVKTLASEAALLRDENAVVETFLAAQAKGVIELSAEGVVLNRALFLALPIALKRRMFRRAVEAAGHASFDLSHIQVDEALQFLENAQTGRVLELPCGFGISREYQQFLVRERRQTVRLAADLAVPGMTVIPHLGIVIETRVAERHGPQEGTEETGAENYIWQASFDYDKIGALITVRNRAAGDWFCPSGMGGKSKKLQDFFVDAQVPRSKRDFVPLLSAGGSIVWVIGHRTDERFRPGPDTRRVLIVTVRRP